MLDQMQAEFMPKYASIVEGEAHAISRWTQVFSTFLTQFPLSKLPRAVELSLHAGQKFHLPIL